MLQHLPTEIFLYNFLTCRRFPQPQEFTKKKNNYIEKSVSHMDKPDHCMDKSSENEC